MKFFTFEQFGSLNSSPVFGAFRRGVERLNLKFAESEDDADVAVIWSVLWHGRMAGNKEIFEKFQKKGKPVIVLEVGAIKRGITWKVGVNGINNEAQFNHEKNHNDSRFRQLGIKLLPWQQNKNGKILICCQHTASHQWRNMPRTDLWLENIINEVKKHSQREIVIRPHPRQAIPNFPKFLKRPGIDIHIPTKIANTYDDFDFEDDLREAWCVINWSSNPAIESILNGIPAIVGPDSLAYPVAEKNIKNIENPLIPERQSWANNFAYTEWTVEEIEQGLPLLQLMPVLLKSYLTLAVLGVKIKICQ